VAAVALAPPAVDSVVARNVLVAFDGSPGAHRALECAITVARGSHGRLTLLTVVPRMPPPAPGMIGAYDPTSIECGMVDALRAAAETIPDDIPVTTIVGHGHAAAEIVRRVEAGCFDLVVLGWEGHGPMKGAVAGVGRKVMRHCTVPVLVVHAPRC
jgi:nucleotide-binding universal stress UspA family protein